MRKLTLLTVALAIGLVAILPALAQETRVEHASIVYTAITFESKHVPDKRTRLWRDVPYAECDTLADGLTTTLQTIEADSALAVHRQNWVSTSEAVCVKGFTMVADDTFRMALFCELVYDPAFTDVLAQDAAQCSQQ